MSREEGLARFRGLPFIPSHVHVLDALVLFVPYGQPISATVQQVLDRTGPGRWFEVEGGHEFLVSYEGGPYDKSFKLRPKAWDFEVCSSCGRRLPVTTPCWITEHGPYNVLCTACKARLDADRDEGA